LPYGMLGDIRVAAQIRRNKIDAALRSGHAEQVDLICHSAGGLVARYYGMYMGGRTKVDHLVTIGTPHQGPYFSWLIGPPLSGIAHVAKQTRPGSMFLDEINGPGAIPEGITIHNVWSPFDGMVIPTHNSKSVMVPFVTHGAFLWRPDVYEVVAKIIAPNPAPVNE
jgi:triacylglycerol lipase